MSRHGDRVPVRLGVPFPTRFLALGRLISVRVIVIEDRQLKYFGGDKHGSTNDHVY